MTVSGRMFNRVQVWGHSRTFTELSLSHCVGLAVWIIMLEGEPSAQSEILIAIACPAGTLRLHSGVKVITMGFLEHKISLHAGDIILFLSSPKHSVLTSLTICTELSTYPAKRWSSVNLRPCPWEPSVTQTIWLTSFLNGPSLISHTC